MAISNQAPMGIDDKLRAHTWRVIQRVLGLGLPPPKQWWNLPAKSDVSRAIFRDESAKHAGHHNDAGDAMRHATWARRSAEAVGPIFSMGAGLAHEAQNMLPRWSDDRDRQEHGEPFSEALMDMINNTEGVRSWQERRPINPARLADRPVSIRQNLRDGYGRR